MARRWDSSYGKLQDPLPKDTYNVTDEEKAYWNRKQERLVYDPVPTEGSINTVTSGAVHAAIKDSAEQTAKEYKKYFNSSQVGLQALSDAIAESVTKLQEVQEEVERKRREVVQKGELVDQRTYAALSYQNGAADCAAAAEASASETATSAANAKASAQTAKAYMEEAKQTDVSTLVTEVDGVKSDVVYYEQSGYLSKNLLKFTSLETKTSDGVTCTNNGDGTYTLNGTASANVFFDVVLTSDFSKFGLEVGKTYKLVGCPSGGSDSGYQIKGRNAGGIYDIGNGWSFNYDSSITDYKVVIRVGSGTVCNNLVFKPMLTTDLSATYDDFTPYAPSNTELQSEVDEIDNGLNSLFRYYEGVDLTQKFASEIANYSDEWAWIKARIQAGNFKGMYVCDYIPITCSNGYVLNAQVAGINTYKGYGDQQVRNHIDFICKELWDDKHVMNKVGYNNGNANSPSPFLASDLNYWLNSMSGNVPNSTSDPSVTTEVDYTTSGVLYYLPDKLKNQIITKRVMLPSRYTEGKVLTNDNSWAWQSTGKLWVPSEVEVYGAPCWGNSGYGMGGFVQYPIFACNMNRAKLRCASKDRCYWWLLSTYAGNSTHFAHVTAAASCQANSATYTSVALPVCFRIG